MILSDIYFIFEEEIKLFFYRKTPNILSFLLYIITDQLCDLQELFLCPVCSTDRASVDEAVVEASHPAKHLLAVGVQLLQLVLDQHSIQWSALLDQVLSEHDEGVDFVGVEGDLLLEGLQRDTR